jgi:tetratricopeptide (TPR) repeat protein
MKKSKFAMILLLLMFSLSVSAETSEGMARDALQAFERGEYQEAIQKWEELLELGYVNGNLYFNIANAYWRLGKPGQTYRYLIMAKRLDPRDAKTRANLSFVKDKLGFTQKIPEGPLGLVQRIPWWHLSLNYFETLYFLGIASFLFFGYLFLGRLKKKRPSLKALVPLATLWVVALVFWAYRGSSHFFRSQGIIIGTQVPLLTAPSVEAVSGIELPEGSSVKIVKRQGDFRLVKTVGGKEGWLEIKGIGEIN